MSPQTSAAGSFGIGVISALESGFAQKKAGQDEQAAYNYNATITEQNMDQALIANEQRYSQLVGKQATAYAAAGVDITSGSPLLMMAATAGRGGRQAAEIYQSGTEQSMLQRYYGKIAAWRGKMAGVGAMLGGISSAAQNYLKATGYEGGDISNPSGSGKSTSSGDWIQWGTIDDTFN